MKITQKDIAPIAARTLGHYEARAQEFWEGTKDHDVSQNIQALLSRIEAPGPFTVLDFGCGPGRDLKTFRDLGHQAIGLDGSAAFVALAREKSGCEVWHQNFIQLQLPNGRFDGIFANAVLFHIPTLILPRVLKELYSTLKRGGVFFCSNPRGEGQESWNGERFGAFLDLASWRAYMVDAGFIELDHYYRPIGLPFEQQPWLASVWRKPVDQK
jgi:SAM-dependent methyltransferase